MSRPSPLDLDRYSSLEKSRRSTSRSQSRSQDLPGEVLCDFCTTRKQKAEKSCLVCLASYCETHLQTHYDYPALMKHKLVKATGQMREKICAQHDKLLEAFCRTDETSVCVLCMMDEHKHHDIVPAGTERTEKQKQLGSTLNKSQQRIDQRVKKWQDLRQAVESVKHSAQTAQEENERIFTELLLSIERKYNEGWQSLSGPSGYEDLNNISVAPNYSFDATKRAIASLKLQVEEVSKTEMSKIAGTVKDVYITQESETRTRRESMLREQPKTREEPKTREQPKTRDDFLKYSCQLVLEVNSVHRNLHLSEGNRTATMKNEPKNYPDHPDRFDHWQQVLCRESLTDRCYWEVDWSGTEIDIAATYRGIRRKGNSNECSLGWNDKSWSLYCSDSKYSFVHNNKSKDIAAPMSSRIGIYLDHAAGILAFYSVSDGMQLLHRVQTTFTQPLYPAFSVWGFGTTIKL
ncbi:hypothetical protein FQN60_014992 [Etheostoma spectabile]|uniref:B30.2/SPRY domain-containing protein n=1 Tax=Etheostoma spectabile TaxID=54343 RepID=A0A5J5CQQ0_9PERO|nr:hypothetical protein FQN60_014992 [Etheostoma spectabile]